jgi:hypothetical protein
VQVGLHDRYPGTIQRKSGEISTKIPHAEAGAQDILSVRVSWSSPPALEVTGDLDKEERRVGRSGYDLGAGSTGCNGGINERLREGGVASLSPFVFGRTEVTRELS